VNASIFDKQCACESGVFNLSCPRVALSASGEAVLPEGKKFAFFSGGKRLIKKRYTWMKTKKIPV